MNEKIRAFIAIELENESTLNEIEHYQAELQKSIGPLKLVKRDLMHVTLRFLGDITKSQAEHIYNFLEEAINTQYFANGSLTSRIKDVGDFGKKVFFVDIAGQVDVLTEINAQIEKYLLKTYNFPKDPKGFTPHLTIARARDTQGSSKKPMGNPGQKTYHDLKSEYKDHDFGEWTLSKVVLKQSVLTPTGPIYTNLKF
jgi:2'-5' RNA ligase